MAAKYRLSRAELGFLKELAGIEGIPGIPAKGAEKEKASPEAVRGSLSRKGYIRDGEEGKIALRVSLYDILQTVRNSRVLLTGACFEKDAPPCRFVICFAQKRIVYLSEDGEDYDLLALPSWQMAVGALTSHVGEYKNQQMTVDVDFKKQRNAPEKVLMLMTIDTGVKERNGLYFLADLDDEQILLGLRTEETWAVKPTREDFAGLFADWMKQAAEEETADENGMKQAEEKTHGQ